MVPVRESIREHVNAAFDCTLKWLAISKVPYFTIVPR